MKNRAQFIRALATAAATASILSFGLTASAQDAAKKAPAAKAATVSACKGLAEAACKANTAECAWIAPKAGKQKPYCLKASEEVSFARRSGRAATPWCGRRY